MCDRKALCPKNLRHQVVMSIWEPDCAPKGIVQIFHGMVEHIDRYEEFAYYLNSKGYVVAGDDHRGHGRTAGADFFGKDIFNKIRSLVFAVQLKLRICDKSAYFRLYTAHICRTAQNTAVDIRRILLNIALRQKGAV